MGLMPVRSLCVRASTRLCRQHLLASFSGCPISLRMPNRSQNAQESVSKHLSQNAQESSVSKHFGGVTELMAASKVHTQRVEPLAAFLQIITKEIAKPIV